MKILAISDIVTPELSGRFDTEPFADIDLIVSCGDLPPEYLSSIRDRLDVPLIYVRGNHDIRYRTAPPKGCLDLHRRRISVNGFKFMGLEGSRWYNGGLIQYREIQMRRMVWGMLPGLWFNGGVDVIITHAPPRHVNDAEDPCHRGFKSYVPLIKRFSPHFFLHGHIHTHFTHPDQRVSRLGDTRVVNCFAFHVLEMDHA
ncbi:MAG: metallophosphoesterase [Proteobacteria bacterium]|nr:MAG: metallophosphoesterase [Pseudomonadota bacterium]PIE67547.1 MAG: metallophosphoesterase [Deltaproteobacteria bacterium]